MPSKAAGIANGAQTTHVIRRHTNPQTQKATGGKHHDMLDVGLRFLKETENDLQTQNVV